MSSAFSTEYQCLIGEALALDEKDIFECFWDITVSKEEHVLLLHGKDAENFISLLQTVRFCFFMSERH